MDANNTQTARILATKPAADAPLINQVVYSDEAVVYLVDYLMRRGYAVRVVAPNREGWVR
jgi:hypothetical protein